MSSQVENEFLESFTDIEVSMSSDAAGKKLSIRLPLSDSNTLESDFSEITDDREHFSIGEQSNPYAAKCSHRTGIYEVEEVSNESDNDDSEELAPITPAQFNPVHKNQNENFV